MGGREGRERESKCFSRHRFVCPQGSTYRPYDSFPFFRVLTSSVSGRRRRDPEVVTPRSLAWTTRTRERGPDPPETTGTPPAPTNGSGVHHTSAFVLRRTRGVLDGPTPLTSEDPPSTPGPPTRRSPSLSPLLSPTPLPTVPFLVSRPVPLFDPDPGSLFTSPSPTPSTATRSSPVTDPTPFGPTPGATRLGS